MKHIKIPDLFYPCDNKSIIMDNLAPGAQQMSAILSYF
jgi:hypothetical protein